MGYVDPCVNPQGPPCKAKYFYMIDSELVPWGKGEKEPREGSEKNMKPWSLKQWES